MLVPTNLPLSQVTQTTRLIEDYGAQGTGVLHGKLQRGVSFFLAHVVMDNTPAKGSALIGIKVVAAQFAASHMTDHMTLGAEGVLPRG